MPPHLATGDTQTLPALIALLLEEQQSGSIVLLQSMGVGIPVYRHAAAKTQLGCVSGSSGQWSCNVQAPPYLCCR
jgi:hypothetical protein